MESSGSTLAHFLKTAGQNSATFRAYISSAEDGEVNIRSILANLDGYESSDGEVDADSDTSPPHPPQRGERTNPTQR